MIIQRYIKLLSFGIFFNVFVILNVNEGSR